MHDGFLKSSPTSQWSMSRLLQGVVCNVQRLHWQSCGQKKSRVDVEASMPHMPSMSSSNLSLISTSVSSAPGKVYVAVMEGNTRADLLEGSLASIPPEETSDCQAADAGAGRARHEERRFHDETVATFQVSSLDELLHDRDHSGSESGRAQGRPRSYDLGDFLKRCKLANPGPSTLTVSLRRMNGSGGSYQGYSCVHQRGIRRVQLVGADASTSMLRRPTRCWNTEVRPPVSIHRCMCSSP